MIPMMTVQRHAELQSFFAAYITDLTTRNRETMSLMARLENFQHHPVERTHLERRLREERRVLDSVVFTAVWGPVLSRVRVRP